MTYVQKTGNLYRDGAFLGRCYSGKGLGLNNPDAQNLRSTGPIPQGLWRIEGPPYDTPAHGPFVLRLVPDPATETFGRSGFLIHGDLVGHEGENLASEGCIIAGPAIRHDVWSAVQAGDSALRVTGQEADADAC